MFDQIRPVFIGWLFLTLLPKLAEFDWLSVNWFIPNIDLCMYIVLHSNQHMCIGCMFIVHFHTGAERLLQK